ncbi:hypothetical protein A0J61_11491, partial [Choanephora cucurbitarum]
MSLCTKTLTFKTNAILCKDFGTADFEVGLWVAEDVDFRILFTEERRKAVAFVNQGKYMKEDHY